MVNCPNCGKETGINARWVLEPLLPLSWRAVYGWPQSSKAKREYFSVLHRTSFQASI